MNTRRFRHRGFASIELPLVIAFLAILIAILLPILARTRDSARQRACLANLRQAGQALRLYAQDYDDHLPVATDDPLPAPVQGSPLRSLRDILSPYVTDPEVWHCRADHGLSDSSRPSAFTVLGSSYIYRGDLARHGAKLASRTNPSPTALLADASDWHPRQRRNVLFADGHAQSLVPDAFSTAWTVQPAEQMRVGTVMPQKDRHPVVPRP